MFQLTYKFILFRLSYMSTKQIANGLFTNSLTHNNNSANSNSNSAFEIINDGSQHESSKNSTNSDNDDQLIEIYEAKVTYNHFIRSKKYRVLKL